MSKRRNFNSAFERLIKFVHKIFWRFYSFSLERIISGELIKCKTICDVGCGDGSFLSRIKLISDNDFTNLVGCDIYMPYLLTAKNDKVYNNLVRCDIRNLPLKSNQFDAVLVINVIEHLEKDDKYIESIEKLARDKIIFTTSKGYSHNPENGVIYQKHLSGHDIGDFKHRGYIVRGLGCRVICGKWYKEGKIPFFIRPAFSLLSLLLTLVTYYHPKLADCLICIKQKR